MSSFCVPETKCDYYNFFPSTKEIIYDETIDRQILGKMGVLRSTHMRCYVINMTILLFILLHAYIIHLLYSRRLIKVFHTSHLYFTSVLYFVDKYDLFFEPIRYKGDKNNIYQRVSNTCSYIFNVLHCRDDIILMLNFGINTCVQTNLRLPLKLWMPYHSQVPVCISGETSRNNLTCFMLG